MEQLGLIAEVPEEKAEEKEERVRPPHVAAAVERVHVARENLKKAEEELERATAVVRALGIRGNDSPLKKQRQAIRKADRLKEAAEKKRIENERRAAAGRLLALVLRSLARDKVASEAGHDAERFILEEDARRHALQNLAGSSLD